MKIPVHPGDQLDHYRIEDMAGHQGSASIFRAIDVENNRQVAIKIPNFDPESDPVAFERLQREQEIGSSLDHPGLLKVFTDEHRSQSYIVGEWFSGEQLRSLLTGTPVAQHRAVKIALKVAEALFYLHNRGVVHRNLRPENILVNGDNDVKLVNFGVAAKVGARRITFTNLAQVVGFSEYISPEELNGKRGDARSDIYALGIILYEMLTGKLPFESGGALERLTKEPMPPTKVNPAISPALDDIIHRAIERQPKNRYTNAHEFAQGLANPEQIDIDKFQTDVPRTKSENSWKKSWVYLGTAVIPVAIFLLLLYFARN